LVTSFSVILLTQVVWTRSQPPQRSQRPSRTGPPESVIAAMATAHHVMPASPAAVHVARLALKTYVCMKASW
jgi:hypothetical protein